MKRINKVLLVLVICSLWCSSIDAQTTLASYVVGNGAAVITNSNHNLSATIGQPIIGNTSNTLHTNSIGFWYQYAKTIVDVEEDWSFGTPLEFELFQNYPNPFNPTTVIRYGIPKESSVKVIVYNILGEIVNILVNTTQISGYYEVNFNASNLASGVYIYSIQSRALDDSKDFRSVKKMILLR